LPTKITPHLDHIVFNLRGVVCRADTVDAQLIADGNWQLWRHGIVDADTKRLLAKSITGYRIIAYCNDDKTDLRRRNLRNSRSLCWKAKFARKFRDAKIHFCSKRSRWIVRRQVSGVRLWKSCNTEQEAWFYCNIFSHLGAAEMGQYKRAVSPMDEQFVWLQQDFAKEIVGRCETKVAIAQKAFAAGVMARDFIGKRNAEALCD
jgi:hypothetical protein